MQVIAVLVCLLAAYGYIESEQFVTAWLFIAVSILQVWAMRKKLGPGATVPSWERRIGHSGQKTTRHIQSRPIHTTKEIDARGE